ncbi:hypothetical protein BKA57DRAFT_439164 [Linnemannia elongata]|nr:hypothetical protein BGZ88_006608 [Linnemannia elongata]KAH7046128.1 hypothetical protein BKA57DRAFT_439164 [Linnemannia elongata]KAK5802024.1 hypothetical protein F5H01DRAFT_325978 [Linnemannia elongata]
MAQAAARPLSSSSTDNTCKSVQFSRFIKISFTYPGDEYDRTALEPAKLSFSEATELMQLRIDWKQELNKRMQQQAQQEQQQMLLNSQHQQDSEDGFSSDESTLCGSSSSSPRAVMSSSSKSSRGCLRSSPSLKVSSKGCGSSGSSSSGPSSPIDCNNGGSLSDDEDGEYHQARAKSLGGGGMMHRHNEFHQPTENMPCLA